MMNRWLESKRCLVIGGGSGIGRAVCDAVIAERARLSVLKLDRAKAEAVDATVEVHGGLDILVNCVGVFDFYRGLSDIDEAQLMQAFDEIYRVNVLSQVLSVKATLAEVRRNRGSVVLTVSTSGFYPGRGGVLYVSSKHALRGLTLSLAHELAPDVRGNGVAPGGTLGTDLAGPASLNLADNRMPDGKERTTDLESRTPLQVALTAKDHATSYVFLASDRSRDITGTFHPDGGMAVKP